MIRKIFDRKWLQIWIPLAVTAFFLLLSHSRFYGNLVNTTTDFKWQQLYHAERADSSVVLIAIDNGSLDNAENKLNISWPWPRQFYAIVLGYLADAGAASVMVDILMDDPERDRMEFGGGSSDPELADALSESSRTVLAAMIQNEGHLAQRNPEPLSLSFPGAETIPGPDFHGLRLPIPEFTDAGAGIGIANFHSDADGTCRRLPLFYRVNGRLYPQLALSAYLAATGDTLVSYESRSRRLLTRQRQFCLDADGSYPLYWYGPGDAGGAFRYESFYAVLMSAVKHMTAIDPDIPLRQFTGKNIIICASASGLVDLKTTPFTAINAYPGGEIHATLLSNLLNGHRLSTLPLLLIGLAAFLLGLLLTRSFLQHSLRLSLPLLLASALLILAANFFLFRTQALDFDLLLPLGILIFSSGAASAYRIVSEGRAKRQIRSMFSRYLSDDVINLLLQNPDQVDLEGRELTGTVLFTDLQNFTTYSEDKTPRDVIRVLNRYFGVITGIVLEQGGLLDKYTGDGIMAVFGAPVPGENHARAACEVILEFRRHRVSELIPVKGGEIATRIGISSGPMVVGNLGSEQRMDYTAIGDTVNLSARLEGVNKSYGTTNMLSEFSWEFVKDLYCFRELDLIRVKGKNRPIRIFTLIDRLENIDDAIREREARFQAAKVLYNQRNWKKAIEAFEAVLALDADDKPSLAFIDRCRLLKKHDDLVDEDGVFTFKTK